MAFKDTQVVWKLKQNITMPYALQEETEVAPVQDSIVPEESAPATIENTQPSTAQVLETQAQTNPVAPENTSFHESTVNTDNAEQSNQNQILNTEVSTQASFVAINHSEQNNVNSLPENADNAFVAPNVNTENNISVNNISANTNATGNSAPITNASSNSALNNSTETPLYPHENSSSNAPVQNIVTANTLPTETSADSVSDESAVIGKTQFNGLFNVGTQNAVINGVEVATPVDAQRLPRWRTLPYRLRQKRADIYINKNASVDFVQSLSDYLLKKGLTILPYDDSVHYLPSDVLLLDKTDLVDAGIAIYLQQGKKEVYRQLKEEFGDRV